MKAHTVRVPLTATNLQNDIIARIQYDGWDAWRVNTVGLYDQQTGSRRKVKATELGKADTFCCLAGIFVTIELKVSKSDRQRDDQKLFENRVIRAGGHYVIVKDQTEFLKWYEGFKIKHKLVVNRTAEVKNQLKLI